MHLVLRGENSSGMLAEHCPRSDGMARSAGKQYHELDMIVAQLRESLAL